LVEYDTIKPEAEGENIKGACSSIIRIGEDKMKTLNEIKEILNKYRDEIKREFKAEIIGVFGSYVRGEEKPESDVDILVRFKEGATLFDLVGLAEFLEERIGIKVDVVSERALRPELKEQILKEVVTV
jgi:predicted nucleotidyltransferase